jgi:tetratricopeptide (TPR) repeat protein
MTVGRLLGGSLCVLAAAAVLAWLLLPASPDPGSAEPAPHAADARAFWATYREAGARRMAGDCGSAVPLYRDALALRPDHEDSLYYLGNCLLEQRAWTEAIGVYQRLVSLNPAGSSRAYMQWALAHASLQPDAPHDLHEAERIFRRALDVDPDSGARLGLAEIALLRGDPRGARVLLEDIAAESPMSVPAPYLLGYLASRAGEADEAWRHFVTAVERMRTGTPVSRWSEEGDVKAAPALRWQALARQSVFGECWLALLEDRQGGQTPTPADMARAYRQLDEVIAAARARAR